MTFLKENTSLMFSENVTEPAKVDKEFRKKNERPKLKGAYVMDMHILLEIMNLILSLQSNPKKNSLENSLHCYSLLLAMSFQDLQSGGGKLAGILKTLSEKN
jgi:large subunit ribosomal protein L10